MPCSPVLPDSATDASRCPLCGDDNRCAMEAGDAVNCWCMVADFAEGVRERLPASARGRACICARCARGETAVPAH